MNRLALAALLLPVAALAAAAGDIYVPDNKPGQGNGNSWPFYTYNDWRYQLLIPAKFLGGKPFQITDIGIAPTNATGTFTARQCQIRIAHTTRSRLTSVFAANLGSRPVTMFNGPFSFKFAQNRWSDFGLTGTFPYDGTSNVVLEIRYQGGSKNIRVHTSPLLERCYTHNGGSNDPYHAATCIWPTPGPFMGMKVHVKTVDALIVGSGTGRIGSTLDLILRSPTDPGLVYQVGTSLSNGPIPLGNRQIGLGLDDLLVVTVGGFLPAVFRAYAGRLDSRGAGLARISLLNDPALVGVRLYSAFVTLKSGAPFNIQTISNTFDFAISK